MKVRKFTSWYLQTYATISSETSLLQTDVTYEVVPRPLPLPSLTAVKYCRGKEKCPLRPLLFL